MTFDEFMKLPLDSRKRIEEKIVDLDRAIQSEYGISMLDTEKRLARKMNDQGTDLPTEDSKPASGDLEAH
jgi:hypothetical protein